MKCACIVAFVASKTPEQSSTHATRWVKIHSSIGFRGIFHHFALAEDGEHLHPFEGDEGLLNGSWPLCHIERSTPC